MYVGKDSKLWFIIKDSIKELLGKGCKRSQLQKYIWGVNPWCFDQILKEVEEEA